MPDNTGEDLAQDGNMKPVDGGILYTDTNPETAEIKNKRMTGEGFEVAGHGHRTTAIYAAVAIRGADPTPVELDISEEGITIVTWDDSHDAQIDLEFIGLEAPSGATEFPLETIDLSTFPTDYREISSPWPILLIRPTRAAGAPSAGDLTMNALRKT